MDCWIERSPDFRLPTSVFQLPSSLKIFTTFAGLFYFVEMSEQGIGHIVYSKNVVEFVTVASEYCATIEQVGRHKADENLGKLQKILPLLYLKAAVLPPVEQVLDEELEKFVSELDYSNLQQKWLQQLGEYDSFYEVFDPNIQFGDETVTASVSENLLDIYQELKDFVTAYSIGNEEVMNDSLAECIFHFGEYWGQQLVNVLRAVHMLVVTGVDFSEKSEEDAAAPGKGSPKWLDNFWGMNEEED
jgi:hypothetical protein